VLALLKIGLITLFHGTGGFKICAIVKAGAVACPTLIYLPKGQNGKQRGIDTHTREGFQFFE
jgi:hypothetical protein